MHEALSALSAPQAAPAGAGRPALLRAAPGQDERGAGLADARGPAQQDCLLGEVLGLAARLLVLCGHDALERHPLPVRTRVSERRSSGCTALHGGLGATPLSAPSPCQYQHCQGAEAWAPCAEEGMGATPSAPRAPCPPPRTPRCQGLGTHAPCADKAAQAALPGAWVMIVARC